MTDIKEQLAAARKAWLEAAAREEALCSTGPTVEWVKARDVTRAARQAYDNLLFAESAL